LDELDAVDDSLGGRCNNRRRFQHVELHHVPHDVVIAMSVIVQFEKEDIQWNHAIRAGSHGLAHRFGTEPEGSEGVVVVSSKIHQ